MYVTNNKDVISFYSVSNNKYVSSDSDKRDLLFADRKKASTWENFIITYKFNNYVTIQNYKNNYLRADLNGFISASSSSLENSSKFKLIKVSDNVYNIKTYNKKFLFVNNVNQIIASDVPQSFEIIKRKNLLFNSYFTKRQVVILILTLYLLLISVLIFNFFHRSKQALVILIFSGLILRILFALFDPYLHLWDEQFHAMVAKNLMENPLRPSLYFHQLLPVSQNWMNSEIWLHKQPLFLWQIALSFRLFGVSEFTLRLPDVLMFTFLTYIIYRIGKLSVNQRVGFYAAIFFTTGNYFLEIISGVFHTDHNDVAFIFYITASIWALLEYKNTKRKYWLILIGVFSGFAILTKWLLGFLVFSGWGLSILFINSNRKKISNYLEFLLSFVISIAVALPWQIYCFINFHDNYLHELKLSSRHFTEVIEGHSGKWSYYFENMPATLGFNVILVLLALFVLFKKIKSKELKLMIFTYVFIVYLFFSFAQTKMISFTSIVSPFLLIAVASLFDYFFKIFRINQNLRKSVVYNKIFSSILILGISIYIFNFEEVQYQHTNYKPIVEKIRMKKCYYKWIYSQLKKNMDKTYLLFNVPHNHEVQAMFYSGLYSYELNKKLIKYCKNNHKKIVVINDEKLPEYIKNDSTIIILPEKRIHL